MNGNKHGIFTRLGYLDRPFQQYSPSQRIFARQQKISAISVITRAEVLTGFTLEHRQVAAKFLDYFVTLNIDKEIADLTADLRYQYHWKLPDALQAALAQHHQLKLVTRNTKDFPLNKYDFVITPYQL